jgi:hypothetical protein
MANDWDDDDDMFEDTNRQKDDSSAMREVRRAAREAEKRAKALEEELAGLRSEQRNRLVTETLRENGLNPKIAAFVPKDLEIDKITSFIEEYADVFNPAPTQAVNEEGMQVDPVVNENVQSLSRIASVASSTQPYVGTPDQLSARIAAASSIEELNTLIHGNPFGPSF